VDAYNAIMKAADQIQNNPREFAIGAVQVPKGPGCGSPACALGWISHFAGVEANPCGFSNARVLKLLGINGDREFYPRMSELNGERHTVETWNDWARDAALCAHTLRLYAAKYHAPKRTDSELVADLMAKIEKQTVSTEAQSEELAW
jgi:hypothetical protein